MDSTADALDNRSWLVWMLLSLATALVSFIETFYTNTWWNLLGRKFWLIDLISTLTLPLWLLMTFMAFVRFRGARKKIWWLLAPAPVCFWPLIRTFLVLLVWRTNGFAP